MNPALAPELLAELNKIEEAIAYVDQELEDCGGSDVYRELHAERRRLVNEWSSLQGLPEPYDERDEESEG